MRLYLALLLKGDREPTAWEYRRCQLEMVQSGGSYVNAKAIVFPQATGDWGKVTGLGIMETASGDGMLLKIPFPKEEMIDADTRVEIPARSLVLTGVPAKACTIWTMLKEDAHEN